MRTLLQRRICVGMFAISMAALMYELILTRIFSVLMWYHFASMAISLALFGLTAAALLVQLRPALFPPERCAVQCRRFCQLFSLSLLLFFTVFVLFRIWPQFGYRVLSFFHQPFYQPFQQGFYNRGVPWSLLPVLAGLYLVTALPFFFAGLSITLLLRRYLAQVGRLYSWDLLGAGIGCLAIIAVLKLVGGESGLLVIALAGLLAAACFASGWRERLPSMILALAALVLLGINLSQDIAGIRFVRGRYEPGLLWSAWNSFSRVAVYPSRGEELRQAWGLSRTYRGPIPQQLGMVVDDTGYTTLYRWPGEEGMGYFRDNVISLAWRLKPGAKGLVIGPGGGKDVLAALASGAAKVTALEINPLVAEAVNERFAAFTGALYRRPEVELALDEGRSWIRRQQRTWDVIQASAVFGRMAPSAGAFTLSENNLYTLEAFADYWNHLTPDGVLTISRFIFERETLRLVSLGLAFLDRQGVADPAAHIAVIKERGLANFMLKKSPFTAPELARLRAVSADLAFQEVLMPDRREGTDPFHRLVAGYRDGRFFDEFPFDVSPTTDNRPFFYYMYKPADFLTLFTFPAQSRFEDRAVLVLRNLLLVVAGLTFVCLILPLLLSRQERLCLPDCWRRLGYFSCLGLGFMLLEIGLLRRFILFLGQPIYALSVILFSLLVFSGLGSLLAARIPSERVPRLLPGVLLVLILLSQTSNYGLPPLLDALLAEPLTVRCLLAILVLAPLGLLLGMPLPLGMRLLHRDSGHVAWSWGVNGATGVLGSLLAVVVAMNWGYSLTLLAGGLVYALAMLMIMTRSMRAGNS
ncbi:MAG: hypothetical protein D6740_01410 [Alphaproteobacteria bacterium]|nr:MAG: hypothetical protein D6740_01410 [Alphaproteobacteria bacterium]